MRYQGSRFWGVFLELFFFFKHVKIRLWSKYPAKACFSILPWSASSHFWIPEYDKTRNYMTLRLVTIISNQRNRSYILKKPRHLDLLLLSDPFSRLRQYFRYSLQQESPCVLYILKFYQFDEVQMNTKVREKCAINDYENHFMYKRN